MTIPSELRRKRQTQAAIALLTGCAAIALVVVVGLLSVDSVALEEDLCPSERQLAEYWAVIIDASDTYDETQQLWIANALDDLRSEVRPGGRLAIYALKPDGEIPSTPLVALCNPGDGEGVSAVTGNPTLMRRRWDTGFRAPVDSVVGALLQSAPASRSPLMETLQHVRLESMNLPREIPRHMVVVSDMLQYSDIASHYVHVPRFEEFADTQEFRKVRSDFRGWDVQLFYVWRHEPRLASVQGREHIAFWEDYFSELGATLSRVISVEG